VEGQSRTHQELIEENTTLKQKIKDLEQSQAALTRAEEALRESEERYRILFEGINDAVFVHSFDREGLPGRFLQVNDVACRRLGYTREELLSLSPKNITIPEEYERMADKRIGLAVQGDILAETIHVRKDGRQVPVESNIRQFQYFGILVALSISRDITVRKRMEAEKDRLEAQNRQLQKADSLGCMAGAIAHTFNNQLGVVIGNLELAMMEISQNKGYLHRLNAAMKAAHKAAEVSGQMLTYLGQSFNKRELLDLSEACRRNIAIIDASMPGNVILETAWPSPGPAVMCNGNEVQQVLTNLVTNAWEAIGESRGTIRLSVTTVSPSEISAEHRFPLDWQPEAPAYACLEVTDAGCGIADKDVENLFDPFFSNKFTGRGLGLPVVLGIVKSHDGVITVESAAGRGSTFQIFFPLSAEEIIRQPEQVAEIPEYKHGGTVLVVDDEEMVREMAEAMLMRLGFTVLTAKDGVEAVQVFRQRHDEIRFVLCDLTMPHMNGWETLTALRKLAPDIPVLLASGYDKTQVMAGDHTEWPQAFLGKPYKYQGLKDAIGQALLRHARWGGVTVT